MQVNVVFYALSAVLNVMTCVTVYLSKGVTTVNMFVLNIMIPSAVNAVLLLVFGFLQGDEYVFDTCQFLTLRFLGRTLVLLLVRYGTTCTTWLTPTSLITTPWSECFSTCSRISFL
ncbi:hypothetical protein L596_011702 [Steinernema carpocapsae]|uniref:Uncharacterized protein n=1 Tax=Steinernema carpocapsae TaxID=34508 RepID=A0A4U5NVP7_STECR|nr:hypothetical protein L596_011702 [Steinernema carpocapsae]